MTWIDREQHMEALLREFRRYLIAPGGDPDPHMLAEVDFVLADEATRRGPHPIACAACHGTLFAGGERCTVCRGMGAYMASDSDAPQGSEHPNACLRCHGAGLLYDSNGLPSENPCGRCEGAGYWPEPQGESERLWRLVFVVDGAFYSTSVVYKTESDARDALNRWDVNLNWSREQPKPESITIERAQLGPWEVVA